MTIGSIIVVVDYTEEFDSNGEGQKDEGNVPELDVFEVMTEARYTVDSIFESRDDNLKIPNIETKSEMVDYVRSIMSLELGN